MKDLVGTARRLRGLTALPVFIYGTAIAIHGSLMSFAARKGGSHVITFAPRLPDVGHSTLPDLQSVSVVAEICVALPIALLAGLMLTHLDQRSLECARTWMWAHGFLLTLRAVSFASTTLPDASQRCKEARSLGSCHDLVYSGHIAAMVLAILLAQRYFRLSPPVRLTLGLLLITAPVLVVATRNHYTVDVILGAAISTLVYVAFTRHPALLALCAPDTTSACPRAAC
jgi:hypothetical protein